MKTFDFFCFIPAKAASTRLKQKNILQLDGKELIAYPIERAIESEIFGKEVIVSTESKEIRDIALKYGAKVPYIREEKLAHDPYGVADVAIDFLERFSEYRDRFKAIVILLPTAPFLSADDIIHAVELFKKSDNKFLMSVTETGHNAYRSVTIKNDELHPLFPDRILKRTQDLEPTYRINGAIVIAEIQAFMQNNGYFGYPMSVYKMPRSRSIDIDTQFDFDLAKYLIKLHGQ